MATVQGERMALLAAAGRPVAPLPPAAPEWADLFHCLAGAFLPPPADLTGADWCEALADDLEDLGPLLDLDVAAAVGSLRGSGGPLAGARWLVEYSSLFLVPPVAVTLNTGVYLEGGLAGASAQMMEQCYATAGFARRESFHDLPDHVGIQFEFVGALLERAAQGDADAAAMAGEFVAGFVRQWIDPLHAACVRAADGNPAAQIYAALTDLARSALDAVDR